MTAVPLQKREPFWGIGWLAKLKNWLKSLIVTPIDIDELVTGDKNAVLFAARILGYGKDYSFKFRNESTGNDDEYTLDLNMRYAVMFVQ